MSKWLRRNVTALIDPSTQAVVGFSGPSGDEYFLPVAPITPAGAQGVTSGISALSILPNGSAAGTALTNSLTQCVGTFNNYTQNGIQNLSATANASADHIAYPDNITTDGTGFVDIGITSSVYAQAAYSVTGPNEPYVFGSAPSASGTSGDLVSATDSTGTSNGMRFYTNGFAQAIGAFAMKLTGTGLLQVAKGLALTCKTLFNNGATATYTVAAGISYVYLTTSAATLAVTLPAAAAAIDGLIITFVANAAVATASFVSAGATFAVATAALVANTPVRFVYDHASLKWYPA